MWKLRSIFTLLPLVFGLACSGGGGGGNPPPSPTTGSMSLVVNGLPGSVPAAITISGPGSFSQNATGSATIQNLNPGSYTLNAANVISGDSTYLGSPATQSVTVIAGQTVVATVTYATQAISVTVNPSSANLTTGGTQPFSATVTNSANQTVTWSVDPRGPVNVGSITAAGLYAAPSAAGIFTVRATSQADPTKSGTATVTVTAPSQTLRIFVAGESIEQFNRFMAAPFNANGSLNDLGAANNDAEQYGWMVPLADRLRVRGTGVSVEWVGAAPWITRSWNTSDGTYPSSTPGQSSAVAGTTIAQWLSEHQAELTARTYAYDIAFASRGGNDLSNGVSEAIYKADLSTLIRALDAGSSSRQHPTVYVTAHMPDAAGWNYNHDAASIAAWNAAQHLTYVTWTNEVVQALQASDPALRLVVVDQYTAFMTNKPTTAFPNPSWVAADGGADLVKIHIDEHHPMRLASIYAGEIAADALLAADLQSPPAPASSHPKLWLDATTCSFSQTRNTAP